MRFKENERIHWPRLVQCSMLRKIIKSYFQKIRCLSIVHAVNESECMLLDSMATGLLILPCNLLLLLISMFIIRLYSFVISAVGIYFVYTGVIGIKELYATEVRKEFLTLLLLIRMYCVQFLSQMENLSVLHLNLGLLRASDERILQGVLPLRFLKTSRNQLFLLNMATGYRSGLICSASSNEIDRPYSKGNSKDQ